MQIDFIPPFLYLRVFLVAVAAFCLFQGIYFGTSATNERLLKKTSWIPPLMLCVILIYFIGLRPVSSVFGDTVNYAEGYRFSKDFGDYSIVWKEEWLWAFIEWTCLKTHQVVNTWFLIIAIGYFGFQYIACRKLLWENSWMAMLFVISSFSFYSYSVNGIRNGLGCAIIMCAVAFANKKKTWIIAGVLAFIALGIHRSTILPALSCLAALTVIRNPKYAIWFWLISIPISYFFGGLATTLFQELGFDERLVQYTTGDNSEGTYTTTGFRWDFLLYSSIPVLLTWFVNKKNEERIATEGKELADHNSMKTWNILATTYILSNAFWVMVIRATFSNRFAYLSWFIYPLVIAYAIIRLHIWDNQDRKAGLFLLGHVAFTLVMFLLGKL